MCKSISMISAIDPEKRAPYRAFVCTTRVVSSDEIYRGFLAFYDNYFNLLDIAQAINALQEEIRDDNGFSPFQVLSAENIFSETFNSNRNISGLVDNQLERLNMQKNETTKSIMSDYLRILLNDLHDRFYNYYNFKDLYWYMTELELQQYLFREYPQENARCEWKESKNLKNSFKIQQA